MELITLEEFLYGICNYHLNIAKTAKAPFNEKVKLLYCFFEEDITAGIEFKSFVKMVL